MAKKSKVYKNSLIDEGKTVNTLPEVCRHCYGFSNWKNIPKAIIPEYDHRDCSDCVNNPNRIKKG